MDHSNTSVPYDVDSDGFNETIVLTHHDAYSILSEDSGDLLPRIKATLGDWDFTPSSSGGPEGSSPIELPTAPAATAKMADVAGTPPVGTLDSPRSTDSGHAGAATETPPVPDAALLGKVDRVLEEDLGQTKGLKILVGSSTAAFQNKDYFYYPSNTALNHMNVGIVG